jgi:hypothetical protein
MVEETKICPYCAETIKAAAIVCRYCRRDLPNSAHEEMGSNKQGGDPRKKKKVWLAVVLNLFVLMMGLGHIFLRKYGRFPIVFSLQLFTLMPMTWLGLSEYNKYLLFIIWIWNLFDVQKQARSYNASLQMA